MNQPIVDTHLHLWDTKRFRYLWLKDVPFLDRNFLIEDFHKECGTVKVGKMVFVQCECIREQSLAELDWVTSIAKVDPRIEGIVPWAPLEKGDAAREYLDRIAQNKLVKGIRRITQHEMGGSIDPDFSVRPNFVRGVQLLAEYNLSMDLCIGHKDFPNTIELVRRCPDTQFILDHIGKPDIKNHVLHPWKEQIATLAKLPDVWCKVSGLVTEADLMNWTPQDLQPYLDHVVECFGFDRVMYGGDWPVAFQACEYPRWVETLERAVAGCSASEIDKLFRTNAVKFYRLSPNS